MRSTADRPEHPSAPKGRKAGGARLGVITVALLAALTGTQLPAALGSAPQPEHCFPSVELQETVDELGGDHSNWSFDSGLDYWGVARINSGKARIDVRTPCRHVADVVRHEWVHLQQGRFYGSRDAAVEALGEDGLEIVADCGAQLLGATLTPYLDPEQDQYLGGCAPEDYEAARRIIGHK